MPKVCAHEPAPQSTGVGMQLLTMQRLARPLLTRLLHSSCRRVHNGAIVLWRLRLYETWSDYRLLWLHLLRWRLVHNL